jgi:hypothetical protein
MGKDSDLPTHIVNLEGNEAYREIRLAFAQKDCIIAVEEPPKQFTAKQGSLWGVSPRDAKKIITVTLQPAGDKTIVGYSSKLASKWVNVTVVGCVLAFVFTAVCVWMALDLSAFLVGGNPSTWSWLVTVKGHVEFQAGEAFVNLSWGLAIFLSIIIALEAAVFVYAKSKIELFAQEAISVIG